jgi:hypothetical protein
MFTDKVTEDELRRQTVCQGCGQSKDVGCVVCWGCFKYRQDVEPFKYFDGDIGQWLEMVRKEARHVVCP